MQDVRVPQTKGNNADFLQLGNGQEIRKHCQTSNLQKEREDRERQQGERKNDSESKREWAGERDRENKSKKAGEVIFCASKQPINLNNQIKMPLLALTPVGTLV